MDPLIEIWRWLLDNIWDNKGPSSRSAPTNKKVRVQWSTRNGGWPYGAGLLNRSAASYVAVAMIRGDIAIPDIDPKTWRAKARKKRAQPASASAIVTPAPMKKRPTVGNQETE